jgi:competence protein ComEC
MERIVKILGLFLVLTAGLLGVCLAGLPDGKLHVYVLDIGQGDAILIVTPANEHILIDGGPDDTVLRKLGDVMPFYEHTIDVLILTHPHADHVNGLIEVLKRYKVKQAIITGVHYGTAANEEFVELLAAKKVQVFFAGSEDYRLGNILLDSLFPFESETGASFNNLNNSSYVFRLIYGGEIFYFAGDLEKEGEAKLVSSGLDLRADFYKVGHHGSRTSSSVALLDLMKPEDAVISCGVDNKYKHPHAETLQKLAERGIRLFRTDIGGTIGAVSDGAGVKVSAMGK